MSQLSLKTVKLGDSADTSKNFLISVPATPDGTLTIERESGTDVLTVDASGVITANCGIGANQSWQDVTASRVIGATYTNTSGRAIQLCVTCTSSTAAQASVVVNGITVTNSGGQDTVGYSMALNGIIIPKGATYSISVNAGTPSLASWVELR